MPKLKSYKHQPEFPSDEQNFEGQKNETDVTESPEFPSDDALPEDENEGASDTRLSDEPPHEEIRPKETKEMPWEKVEIDTMKDFIDVLKMQYDFVQDEAIKAKLAYHIIKLEIALNVAHVSAREVFVRKTPDGILGYYDRNADQIAISRDQLDDFTTDQQLYNTVLVHEKTHQEGIMDEGLAQKVVARKISATPGIYAHEQRDVQNTFYRVSMEKALDLYEIENPQELTEYYLEVELKKLWEEKLKSHF